MAGGLLGYAASMGQGINSLADWLEERARFAGGRVKRLATDPVGLLGTMAGEAGKSFTDFADAAARGDTGATVEGLLNSGLAGPLTFAGVGAKTADKVALQRAKQMANLGEDPVKIWQTTGWTEQFPDKKWRFEIPDTRAGWIADPAVAGGGKAAKEFAHPDVYAAYPELKNVDVWRSSGLQEGAGQHSPPGVTKHGEISVGIGGDPKTTKSVALHEFQHPIQQREGFARGGSPEGLPQALQQDVSELRKAARKAFDADKRDVGMALEEKARQLEHMAMWGEGAPYELYKRLAGEAEARLTQARMNLTPAERMQRPPWLEFDVPPEQQIVRGLLGEQTGPAMMAGKGQAKPGGEVGLNNEFYKGGQFLPSSERTVKGAIQFPKGQRAGGKAEIEPGVYAIRPIDGAMPLKNQFEFDWQDFRKSGLLKPFVGWSEYKNRTGLLDEASSVADAFNRGARWVKDGQYFDANGNPLK